MPVIDTYNDEETLTLTIVAEFAVLEMGVIEGSTGAINQIDGLLARSGTANRANSQPSELS